MTIEELNKLIQEELGAYLNEAEDGGDDIEVTTDEPAEDGEDDALGTLRQIFDMLKPIVEPEEEGEEEPEMDMEDEEGEEEGDEEEENLDESYGASQDPNNLAYFLLGSVGLGAVVFLTLKRDERREVIDNIKDKAADIKALMKLTGTELKSKAKALAQEVGLIKTADDEEVATEAVDNHTFFRGDNANRVAPKAKDVQGTREKATLKEGFDGTSRFQKLANIKK